LSSKKLFTAKVGEILPCYWQIAIPGNKYRISSDWFTRTVPVNTEYKTSMANQKAAEYGADLARKRSRTHYWDSVSRGLGSIADVQNYIKRVRKYLFQKLGSYETLHFYAVGEYGPVHFRPHYHRPIALRI
jgi:hypothetical protein